MAFLDTMKKGYDKIKGDPGGVLKRIRSNAAEQAHVAKDIAKKSAEEVGMAATRGKGLKPARDLRDILKKSMGKE